MSYKHINKSIYLINIVNYKIKILRSDLYAKRTNQSGKWLYHV